MLISVASELQLDISRGQAENLEHPLQPNSPTAGFGTSNLGHRTGAARGQDRGDGVHSVERKRGPQVDLEPGFTTHPLTPLMPIWHRQLWLRHGVWERGSELDLGAPGEEEALRAWHRRGRDIELLETKWLSGTLVPGKSSVELRTETREGWSSG